MTVRKLFIIALSLAMANDVLPQTVTWAGDGVPATRAEGDEYAQREAQSKGLEEFVGGDALGLGIVITILVIAAVVVLIWYLIEHHHGHANVSPKDAYPRLPGHAVPRFV
jgi:hypothetical protein